MKYLLSTVFVLVLSGCGGSGGSSTNGEGGGGNYTPTPIPTDQNWQITPNTTAPVDTTEHPCNAVRWGKVESVSDGCLALMEKHGFGGSTHTGAVDQIPLSANGQPTMDVLGYMVEWGVYGRKYGVENVPAAQYSKLMFSFLRLMPNGSLTITDPWASLQKDDTGTLLPNLTTDPFASNASNLERGMMKRLIMLKAMFKHLRTGFAVGGWSLSGQFSSVTADPAKRAVLIQSAIEFANKFGFDEIHFDWEYPAIKGNLNANLPGVPYAEITLGSPADPANLTLLLKELHQTIQRAGATTNRPRNASGKLEISLAVGAFPEAIDALKYAEFIDAVDHITIMPYDFNGPWSTIVSHQSALFDNNALSGPKALGGADQSEWNGHDAVLNIIWSLLGERKHKGDNASFTQSQREEAYNKLNAPAQLKKLILGVPYYGQAWSSTLSLPAGSDLVNPWFLGTPATVGSFENGKVDARDLIDSRDGEFNNIRANGRESKWPANAISSNDIHWDPIACTNLVITAGHVITFDDEASLHHKARYVKRNGLGGVMAWSLDGDTRDAKLAKSMVQAFRPDTPSPRGKSCGPS